MRFRCRLWCVVSLLLWSCALIAVRPSPLWAVPPSGAAPVKTAPSPSPSPPVYQGYLADPGTLGFNPDAALFDLIYNKIKTLHVEVNTDAQLYGGVATEVARLLGEGHIPADALSRMVRDASLPQAVVTAYGARVPARVLWYAMVRGLFAGTDDRHSVIFTPREYHALQETLQNRSFGGVGIFVELDRDNHDQLTVIEPIERTPAARAGIEAGDEILRIDGKPTSGMDIETASAGLRGQIGTRVRLTIRRGVETREMELERAAINVPSVSSRMLGDGVGYIRLRVFGSNTAEEFADALDALEKQGARGLVLDVRNNLGGYMRSAIALCCHFIAPGDVVTYLTNRQGIRQDYPDHNVIETHPSRVIRRTRLPMVLLVNALSASASEITAGCLKDYGVATVIGTRTYGKGSVQQVFELPDGAAYKLTIAYFYTPHGLRINKVGVEPDVTVEMEPRLVGRNKGDVQLDRALEYLRTHSAGSLSRP